MQIGLFPGFLFLNNCTRSARISQKTNDLSEMFQSVVHGAMDGGGRRGDVSSFCRRTVLPSLIMDSFQSSGNKYLRGVVSC